MAALSPALLAKQVSIATVRIEKSTMGWIWLARRLPGVRLVSIKQQNPASDEDTSTPQY
jgi:hypothetical protein